MKSINKAAASIGVKIKRARPVLKYKQLAVLANTALFVAGFLYALKADWGILGRVFGVAFYSLTPINLIVSVVDRSRKRLSLSYPLYTFLAFLLLPLLLVVRSYLTEDSAGLIIAGAALVLCGPILAAVNQASGGQKPVKPSAVYLIPAALVLLGGIWALSCALHAVFVPDSGFAGVMLPQFLPYFALSFTALGALSLYFFGRVSWKGSRFPFYIAAALSLPGFAAAFIAALPLFQTPAVIANARNVFASAPFAVVSKTPAAQTANGPITQKFLTETPFSLGLALFGSSYPGLSVERDIVYLQERAKDGKSYAFAYDLWRSSAPGPLPVLIRVHGGAWVSGDKGEGGMPMVNRHFAAAGYAVFDIQYGLSDTGDFDMRAPTPEGLIGPFDIDDMLRHISAFTRYLADNSDALGIDRDRVFISGASAGGQLVLAAALAPNDKSGGGQAVLGIDPRLKTLGVIAFYPAIGLASKLGIKGDPALIDPSGWLRSAAPPLLLYQGGVDGLVSAERVRAFAARANVIGASASLIEFPTAGHGSDLIHWNCYSQVFLYFMERFMAFL